MAGHGMSIARTTKVFEKLTDTSAVTVVTSSAIADSVARYPVPGAKSRYLISFNLSITSFTAFTNMGSLNFFKCYRGIGFNLIKELYCQWVFLFV
ncbi:hypothetical protein TNCT_554521 [Trichonephila clavata]|uniref:Uncharacterized protein n=1 Tax=Trichonephila clavata TaxID=2740835 RepID=A0A8X6G570_TRICU|nr:hypothetical protein TNCT_554521 [Trichonephila clavata]